MTNPNAWNTEPTPPVQYDHYEAPQQSGGSRGGGFYVLATILTLIIIGLVALIVWLLVGDDSDGDDAVAASASVSVSASESSAAEVTQSAETVTNTVTQQTTVSSELPTTDENGSIIGPVDYRLGEYGWHDAPSAQCDQAGQMVYAGTNTTDYVAICQTGANSYSYRSYYGGNSLVADAQRIDSYTYAVDADPYTITVSKGRLAVYDQQGNEVESTRFTDTYSF